MIDGSTWPLYFLADQLQTGLFKGMKIIIQEHRAHRSLLPDPMQLHTQCVKFKCAPGHTDCCCQWIFFNEPDFVAQKSKLEELVESHGYHMIFYLKFHCKVSFIEQCWGFVKHVYHELPATSSKSDPERNVLCALGELLQYCINLILM